MLMTQTAAPAVHTQNFHARPVSSNSRTKQTAAYAQAGPAKSRNILSDEVSDFAYKTRTIPFPMNGLLGNAPQPVMYVRALYDYDADDRTSLSFHEGDVIQVITQLESGWWDGVINGVRGWFPSNYCQVIPNPDDTLDGIANGLHDSETELEDSEEVEDYDDQYGSEDADSESDETAQLPLEGATNGDRSRADFWIPQATPDGRLFYFNTETGESSMELPLESPSSASESGPRDRLNVRVPEKTRPPAEIMSRGYMQDEEEESEGASASEIEGENIMLASGGLSYVSIIFALASRANFSSRERNSLQKLALFHLLHPLTLSTTCLRLDGDWILSPIRTYR